MAARSRSIARRLKVTNFRDRTQVQKRSSQWKGCAFPTECCEKRKMPNSQFALTQFSPVPLRAKKLARDSDAALLEGKTQWKFHHNRIIVQTQAPYLKKEQSNRRNAQYSTGPRSANNKKIVSRNAKPKRRFPWGLAGSGFMFKSRSVCFRFSVSTNQARCASHIFRTGV